MNKIIQNRLSLIIAILTIGGVSMPAVAMIAPQAPGYYQYPNGVYQPQPYQYPQQAYQWQQPQQQPYQYLQQQQAHQQQQVYQWQQQQQQYLQQQQAQQQQALRLQQAYLWQQQQAQQKQQLPQNPVQKKQKAPQQAIPQRAGLVANREIANEEEKNMAMAIDASLRDQQKNEYKNIERINFLRNKIAKANEEIASYTIMTPLAENEEDRATIKASIESLRESITQDTKELNKIQPAAQPIQPKINPAVNPVPASKIPAVAPQADRSRVVEPNNVRPNRAPLHINKIQLYSLPQSDATCGAWAAANAEIALNYCNNPTHIPNDLQNRFLYHDGVRPYQLRNEVAIIRNNRASLQNDGGQYVMATQDRTSPSHLNGQWLDGFEIQDLINRQRLAVNPNQISVWENSDQLLKNPGDYAWIETPRIQFGIPHAFIVGNMRQNGDRGIGRGHWITVVWDGQGNLIIVDSLNGNQQNSPIVDNVVRYVTQQLSRQ